MFEVCVIDLAQATKTNQFCPFNYLRRKRNNNE
jgi:hypothetical protein